MSNSAWRFLAFAATLGLMMLWETVAPRRERVENRWKRTWNNLLLVILNSAIVRVIPVFSAVAAAAWATHNGWGLLNLLDLPAWFETLIVVVLMDMVIYWQHVASHQIPGLWMFHKVHHADHDLDATSGLRFHPVEIAFSMLVKCAGAIVLGASPISILVFEIVLNSCAIFNHSNLKLPLALDRVMRLVLVTPDMHRIHHSVLLEETNSNYGFNIPWWDRMFGSYRDRPRGDHENLKLGIPEFPDSDGTVPLIAMLRIPFLGPRGHNETTD